MRTQRLGRLVAAASLLCCFLGCGQGTSPASGTVSVALVDGPTSDYAQVNLDVQKVEIEQDGWRTLATPNVVVDLLSLRGGVSATLVSGATLPAGRYGQLRLVLGDRNTVKLADGTFVPLTVPSGLQSGVKVLVEFQVEPGTTKDVFIDFDAQRSIQVHGAGHSGTYILRPTVHASDLAVTGSITGQVTAEATGLGLPGALVTAQTLDANGSATIIRSTITGADGKYTLDLLPVGRSCYLVTQPVVGGQVFEASASGALTLTDSMPVLVWSAAVRPTIGTGTIAGTVGATEGEHVDTVFLLQSFSSDGADHELLVRSTVVGGADDYAFEALPSGGYTVKLERVMLNADGSPTLTLTSRFGVVLGVGEVMHLNLGQ